MPSASPPPRPKANELVQFLLIVSLGWLALVAPLLGPGQVFCPPAAAGDPLIQHLPWMQFLRDSLRGGVFPLWNPHNRLGEPFLANPQTAVLFPLSWLYVALPMTTASFLALYFKILVAALGMYVFARRLGMGHSTAAIGGVAFGFMPHFICHAGHVASNSEMWMPWALAATLVYIETGRWRWAAALAGVLTLSLSGGAVQVWAMTIVFVTAFFFWFGNGGSTRRARFRYLGGFFSFIPWTLASSGGLWLSYLDYYRQYEAAPIGPQSNLFLSSPACPMHLLIPSFVGDPLPANGWAWAGTRDVVLYAGVAVLLLALTHIYSRGGWREKAFYLGAIGLFWLACLRQPAALLEAVFRLAPPGEMEFPLLFGFFNLCLLVPALRALEGWRWSEKRGPMIAAAATMALGAVLGALVFHDFFRALGLRSFELRNYAVFFLFLLVAAGALRYWERRHRLAFCALLGLVFADLYLVDRAFVAAVPLRQLRDAQAGVAGLIRQLPDGASARFYAPEIPPESNLFYPFSSIGTGSARAPGEFRRIDPLLDPSLQRGFDLKLAGALGVRYVLTRQYQEPGELKLLRQGSGWFLYEVPGASERLTFHTRVRWAATSSEAISRLVADPEGCREEPALVGSSAQALQYPTTGPAEKDLLTRITIRRADAISVEAGVQIPVGGWLLLRDLYDPGWQATVDGKPVRLFQANGICRAVALPPGNHRVCFSYQPWTFRAGFLVGVVSLLALCGWGVVGWYQWSTGNRKTGS